MKNKMKKILSLLVVVLVLVITLTLTANVSVSSAGGSVLSSDNYKIRIAGKDQRAVFTYTLQADASDASFPAIALSPAAPGITGWYLNDVEVVPGSYNGVGPTNGAWDIDITNANGGLISDNQLDDLSSTVVPTPVSIIEMIRDNWTIAIADNAVNSATVTIRLTFTEN